MARVVVALADIRSSRFDSQFTYDARDLDIERLSRMTTTVPLSAVRNAAHDILAGKVRGRLVVEL